MMIALLAAALTPMPAGWEAREVSYDALLGCYGSFMVSKGLNLDRPEMQLAKWDRSVRKKCSAEIKKHRALVGDKRFDEDWRGLWDEWLSRI